MSAGHLVVAGVGLVLILAALWNVRGHRLHGASDASSDQWASDGGAGSDSHHGADGH